MSRKLVLDHLQRLAEETKSRGISLIVSMEESDKLPAILEIYGQVAELYPHLGITLQAHLYRTQRDLEACMRLPGKIRLVKGAYQEPDGRAMQRGEALNERFLSLVQALIEAHHPLYWLLGTSVSKICKCRLRTRKRTSTMSHSVPCRTIVVTGCASGFGRVTALHLTQRGWQVFSTVRKEADQVSLLAEAALSCQEQLTPLLCDITHSEQIAAPEKVGNTATPGLAYAIMQEPSIAGQWNCSPSTTYVCSSK